MIAYPEWLHVLAWLYLSVSFACALLIVLHQIRQPQKMFIMNWVWPITALYFGPLAIWAYWRSALKGTKTRHRELRRRTEEKLSRIPTSQLLALARSPQPQPTPEQIAVATTHCGAGCTLGDIVGEWWVFAAGLSLAGGQLGTRLLLDFLLAWGFGVVFQYFTIAPMRGLSFGKGVLQAMRADTLSIVAYQVGMSVWAALTFFIFFPGPHLKVNQAVFWFMMQIGMMLGFACSYPVNVFLVKRGWKEKMPQRENEIETELAKAHIADLTA
ncbi:MAG TPA: DUF4396 domain-containing protein [Terriglobales bacterium]|nr:DUF4396 domain-containing protein [Terriglobales bacterium]